MIRPRLHGFGCLGCLTFSGLLPLILIGAFIYWLLNRRQPAAPPPAAPPPPPAGSRFCTQCGATIASTAKFCDHCGGKAD